MKKKYIYNPRTLKYEEYKKSNKSIFLRLVGMGILAIMIGVGLFYYLNRIFPSQEEQALKQELAQMELKYHALNDQVGLMSKVLTNIRKRDESVYKIMFGMEPIDDGLWNGGIGGHETLEFSDGEELINQVDKKVSKLERQFVLQSKVLEEVQALAQQKQEKLAHTPSIKPVKASALKYDVKLLSGFGMRIHPIQHIRKMHTGIDFTCPIGTIIHSTADGVVKRITYSSTGYGKHVLIDHGFGYTTLYGHMSEIDVKEGQEVKRGQKIGLVGNTGSSTGPHVHYEVRINGKPVNPINYVMDGLSPEEYAELVRVSKIPNQSFD